MNKGENTKAFTLAEVLITLLVIGVLAMTTIPSLLQSWEERETITKLKKTYSILQQAYQLAVVENGSPSTWTNNTYYLRELRPFLKLADTGGVFQHCCFYDGNYKYLDGREISTWGSLYKINWDKLLLIDGVALLTFSTDATCSLDSYISNPSTCAIIMADINGAKPPNQNGKDCFYFGLTEKGIIPLGGNSPGMLFSHNSYCRSISSSGFSCARWVIERGNMEYLHKMRSLEAEMVK
ncbi:MAG: type II secretion system protein [Candidatus Gastranaerophilales bacterium]|nr:type II secretion system protein [Candidatus Gastranaerophilales bacterium]